MMVFDAKMFGGRKKKRAHTDSEFLPRGLNRKPGPVLCFCFMLALKTQLAFLPHKYKEGAC